MKKLILLIFALVLALSLAACGGNGKTQGDDTAELEVSTPGVSVQTTAPPSATLPTIVVPSPTSDENTNRADDIQHISLDITATHAYVLNVDSGAVLYEKNSDGHIAPASTAKMLTALTVLEYCSIDDSFTVGSEIGLIASDSSKAWLNQGDKMTVKQLLEALLLASGNDAAYTLAVNTGRKIADDKSLTAQQAVDVFVDAMNRKAAKVGAVSSNFAAPDGCDLAGQYTTAYDLAQIAKTCLGNGVLSEIMGSYRISETLISGREVTYHNTKELLNPNSRYYYSNAIGLKTGSTADAGSCLVSAAVINGTTYICVVMGTEASRYADSLAVYGEIDEALAVPTTEGTPLPAQGAPGQMRRLP
jgi:D-alanyl-D-alanine carboxypeptidase (penicillin-binding protein 5/6)